MNNLIRRGWAVAKINFKQLKVMYLIVGICFITGLIDSIVDIILYKNGIDNGSSLPATNMLILIMVFAPIFITSINFSKLINLGSKKQDFLVGAIINYLFFAFFIALINAFYYFVIKKFLPDIFGIDYLIGFKWNTNFISSLFYQFSFYILLSSFIHLLTQLQKIWIGWFIDILIVTIISVFTPINVLRSILSAFLNFIIMNDYVIVQLIVNLLLAALFMGLSFLNLKSSRNN